MWNPALLSANIPHLPEVTLSSLRRIVSSRANGARSRGPSTQAGKLRSAANSRTHGLLAKCVVLENESPECFQSMLDAYLARFQPSDEVELGIVEEMIAAAWRGRRAWAMETKLLDSAMSALDPAPDNDERLRLTSGFTELSKQPPLELVHRYETRLHRIFQRSLNNFLLLRLVSAESDAGPDGSALPATVEIGKMPNEPSPISGHLDPSSGPSGLT